MDRASLSEARKRAALAALRLNEVETTDAYIGMEVTRAWEGFLSELGRSFNKLFHGERKDCASSAVMAQIRADRNHDPLLSYLRVARNSLEHGLGISGTVGGKGRPLSTHEGVPMVSFTLQDERGNEQVTHLTRENTVVIDELMPILVSVFEGNKRFDPPVVHLGEPVVDPSPVGIGRTALIYLSDRLSAIERLA